MNSQHCHNVRLPIPIEVPRVYSTTRYSIAFRCLKAAIAIAEKYVLHCQIEAAVPVEVCDY